MVLAQAMATLRRWGAFWGLVPVPEGIAYETVYTRARRWMMKREVRLVLGVAVIVEVGLIGSWLYFDHGAHIAQIVADGWETMNGRRVVYAGVCDSTGDSGRVRIVLDAASSHPQHQP